MTVSVARQKANAGDKIRDTFEFEHAISSVAIASESPEKLVRISDHLEKMRPYFLPEDRPTFGKAIRLYNAIGQAKELLTGTPFDMLVDETEDYVSMPHNDRTDDQIYMTMMKWCDNQYFESPKKLAEFLNEIITDMHEEGGKLFAKNVEHAVFEFQKRGSIYNHTPYLSFARLALNRCNDRIFFLDENLDVLLLPKATIAAMRFIVRYI